MSNKIEIANAKWEFDKIKAHIGHKIECAYYGPKGKPYTVCIECVDCGEVLHEQENPAY